MDYSSMISFITFALLLSSAFSQETRDDKRVVGGQVAPSGWFPYQAALAYQGNPMYSPMQFCGGSIIGQQWVVTAGHCLGTTSVDTAIANWRVIVGTNDLSVATSQNMYSLTAVYRHPNYNANTQDNDVLMLKLSRPIVFSSQASPINFANASMAEMNNYANISGWGKMSSDQSNRGQIGSGTDQLMYATVPMVSHYSCSNTYSSMGITVTTNQICAGIVGKDTCQGDSGGPLASNYGGTATLIGITSWGVGCATYPGVYTKVSNYVSFISGCISRGYC